MIDWKIGDSVAVRLDQMSDEEVQTPEQVDTMIDEINETVAKYGFKVRVSGPWKNILSLAVDEQEYIKQLKKEIRKTRS